MKNITVSLLVLVLSITSILAISGCGESKKSMNDKRAKLVGNENIQLKKQLEAKDAEIEELKDIIAEKDIELENARQKSGEASLKMMQHLLEGETRAKQLNTEIEQLKAKIKELQAVEK